jgi:hypothetical protein
MTDRLTRRVTWRKGPDPEFIYIAVVGDEHWVIRLGDFPAEPLYTLMVDGEDVLEFDDWPPAWQRPG